MSKYIKTYSHKNELSDHGWVDARTLIYFYVEQENGFFFVFAKAEALYSFCVSEKFSSVDDAIEEMDSIIWDLQE